jgi:hypothetical protein
MGIIFRFDQPKNRSIICTTNHWVSSSQMQGKSNNINKTKQRYDVFLGNVRGNVYSLQNVNYPDNSKGNDKQINS